MIFLYTLLVSLLTTIALIPALSAVATRFHVVDLPGERKVHERPIPRIGGMAMAAGAFLPVLLWARGDPFIWGWLAGAAIVVIFGIVDDCRDISPKWKFLGQFLAALAVILLGNVQIHTLGMLLPGEADLPGWVALPLTVLAIMGVTNAINLSDGLDGLAGGICLLIFCCIGYLAYLEGDFLIGLVCLAMAGGIFGFLRYNTHPASVFMGDTGSQLLGFTAVTLSLALTQGDTAVSPLLPLLLLGIPVLDTLSVMAIRVMKGRSPFSADKNHIHHNLMALGLHHGESVMAIYTGQTFLVVAAFLLRFHSDWLLLGGYLVFSAASLALLMVAGRNGWHSKPATYVPRFAGFRYLKRLKEEGEFIKPVFRALRIGLPLLLALTCLLPGKMPGYAPYCALGFAGLIAAAWYFKRDRLGEALRLTLYLFIPFVVYESSQATAGWIKGAPLRVYNAAFFLLVVLDILVSKFSKRREGFKSTPLDFLIFFLALVVPNLPEQNLQATHLGQVAAKIVILYFSLEVLMGELRKNLDGLTAGTLVTLLVLSVKGFV